MEKNCFSSHQLRWWKWSVEKQKNNNRKNISFWKNHYTKRQSQQITKGNWTLNTNNYLALNSIWNKYYVYNSINYDLFYFIIIYRFCFWCWNYSLFNFHFHFVCSCFSSCFEKKTEIRHQKKYLSIYLWKAFFLFQYYFHVLLFC